MRMEKHTFRYRKRQNERSVTTTGFSTIFDYGLQIPPNQIGISIILLSLNALISYTESLAP